MSLATEIHVTLARAGGRAVSAFERHAFQRDYLAMLRLADAERSRRQEARGRARANPELVALLTAESHRRGTAGVIDWPEYFRNVDIGGSDGGRP